MKINPIRSLATTNADRLVSITAIIVSAGTLFLFIYQTNLLREEQKASVMPYLEIGVGNKTDRSFLHISNKGLGPAFIDSISIRYKDELYKGDPFLFYANLMKGDFSDVQENFNSHSARDSTGKWPTITHVDRIFPGRLISPGEGMKMLEVQGDENQTAIFNDLFYMKAYGKQLKPEGSTAELNIYYRSVYDDRWVASSNQRSPKTLNQ